MGRSTAHTIVCPRDIRVLRTAMMRGSCITTFFLALACLCTLVTSATSHGVYAKSSSDVEVKSPKRDSAAPSRVAISQVVRSMEMPAPQRSVEVAANGGVNVKQLADTSSIAGTSRASLVANALD